MRTLNENYKKNVAVLQENLKRGMKPSDANEVIDSMEAQFLGASMYGEEEKNFILEMRTAVASHITGIEIVNN
jgi:hypothetical protein